MRMYIVSLLWLAHASFYKLIGNDVITTLPRNPMKASVYIGTLFIFLMFWNSVLFSKEMFVVSLNFALFSCIFDKNLAFGKQIR